MRLYLKRSLISILAILTLLPSSLASASTAPTADPVPVADSVWVTDSELVTDPVTAPDSDEVPASPAEPDAAKVADAAALPEAAPVQETAPDQLQLKTAAEAAPLFQWSFRQGQVLDRTTVVNSVYPDAAAERAELKGVAAIVYDDQRGDVLSLPGGGNGTAWLKLPDQLYSRIKDELSISFGPTSTLRLTPITVCCPPQLPRRG